MRETSRERPRAASEVFVVDERFSSMGRSTIYKATTSTGVYGGISPERMLDVDLGEGSVILVTVELIARRPPGRNPYALKPRRRAATRKR